MIASVDVAVPCTAIGAPLGVAVITIALSAEEIMDAALFWDDGGDNDAPLMVDIVTDGNDNVDTDIFLLLWFTLMFVVYFNRKSFVYDQIVKKKPCEQLMTKKIYIRPTKTPTIHNINNNLIINFIC